MVGWRGERLKTWSRRGAQGRRTPCDRCGVVGRGDARWRSWAGQDGQHVALVRGGSADEIKRGKAATPAATPALLCTILCASARLGCCCLIGETAARRPVWVHARVWRFPRKSAARLLGHMLKEG